MAKLDLKKELSVLFKATNDPAMVTVPALHFLMVDGRGDPNTSVDYLQAIEALYGMSYTVKFIIKKEGGEDYTVLPLEGLWWSDDPLDFVRGAKDKWEWTAMIMQPRLVTASHIEKAKDELKRKKDPPALPKVRFENFEEGLSAQVLHTGPYAEEGPTIERLHKFIEEQGYALHGKHHEIYMGDPRRSKPEKLRTIVRQPVKKL
jgi:hypothetical protein